MLDYKDKRTAEAKITETFLNIEKNHKMIETIIDVFGRTMREAVDNRLSGSLFFLKGLRFSACAFASSL